MHQGISIAINLIAMNGCIEAARRCDMFLRHCRLEMSRYLSDHRQHLF